MSLLTTDNRNLAEIEDELRARIEAQRIAIEEVRGENRRLIDENRQLRRLLDMPSVPDGDCLSYREELAFEVG